MKNGADGGAERMRITPTGAVGIGTTNPGAPLQVGDDSIDHSRGVIRLATREGGGARKWEIGPSPEIGWGFGIRDASDPNPSSLKMFIVYPGLFTGTVDHNRLCPDGYMNDPGVGVRVWHPG